MKQAAMEYSSQLGFQEHERLEALCDEQQAEALLQICSPQSLRRLSAKEQRNAYVLLLIGDSWLVLAVLRTDG